MQVNIIPTIWHPLPMTDMMVRETEAGRKTETRRLVTRLTGIGPVKEFQRTKTPGYEWLMRDKGLRWNDLTHAELLARCPYGAAGHGLWIRQAWTGLFGVPPVYWHDTPRTDRIAANCRETFYGSAGFTDGVRWVPPMFMPRWACRLFAVVTSIRLERLQDITDDSIRAEGVADLTLDDLLGKASRPTILVQMAHVLPHRMPGWWTWEKAARMWPGSFTLQERWRVGWGLINGHRSGCGWEANPWVWVVGYRRLETAEVIASPAWLSGGAS